MASEPEAQTAEEDFQELKDRCKILFEADPGQAHTDLSLWRFLRAFRNVDDAFKAILKCNKWRANFGVASLTEEDEDVQTEMRTGKTLLLRQRDNSGRPILYIAAKKHNANDRDIDRLTKFIVYMLERACEKCYEDVIDNLCIVFDLKDFAMCNMDYQFVKNLIWLLSKYYPERLGVCLVVNAPTVFYGCWTIIRPWMSEATAGKVTFVTTEMQLCEYLNPDILPED